MNWTTSHYELLSLPSLFKHLSGTLEFSGSSLSAKSFMPNEMISIVPSSCVSPSFWAENHISLQGAPVLVHSVQFISYNEYSEARPGKPAPSQFLGLQNQFKKGQGT